jgi:hypothetical protein
MPLREANEGERRSDLLILGLHRFTRNDNIVRTTFDKFCIGDAHEAGFGATPLFGRCADIFCNELSITRHELTNW